MRLRIASAVVAAMGFMPGIAGAQGLGLPVSGFATGGAGLTSFYVIGFELGPWQEYLEHRGDEYPPQPQILEIARRLGAQL